MMHNIETKSTGLEVSPSSTPLTSPFLNQAGQAEIFRNLPQKKRKSSQKNQGGVQQAQKKKASPREHKSEFRQNRFQCDFPGCHKDFGRNFILNRHRKTHTHQEKFCCNFPGCDKEYVQKDGLKNHYATVHEYKRFCCHFPTCHRKFSYKANLVKHQQNIHNILNSLSAQTSPSEPVNYPDGGSILQSSAPGSTIGTIPAPLIPAILMDSIEKDSPDQVFPTQTGLKSNSPECGKKKRKKTRVNFNPVSTQTSAPGSALMTSTQSVHPGNNFRQNRFQCDFPKCGKHFGQNYSLTRHKKTHTHQENFCCNFPECENKYRGKSALKVHYQTVHQHKRFCCHFPKCDKKFVSKKSLVQHQQKIHKNLNSLSAQTSPSEPVNYPGDGSILQSSAPDSTIGTIPAPSIPAILMASIEKDSPDQVFPTQTGLKSNSPECGKKKRKKTRVNFNPVSTQTSAPGSALMTSTQSVHPGNNLSPPSQPHPLEFHISSITNVIQSMLTLILSVPPSTHKQLESQISSVTQTVQSMLVLLPLDPKQRELLDTLVTEALRDIPALILSMPDSTQRIQIFSVTEMVRGMLSVVVPVPDLASSGSHPNPESKQSAPLPDTQIFHKSSGGRYNPTLFSQSSRRPLVDTGSGLQTHATKMVLDKS